MASRLQFFTNTVVCITFVCASIISIAISSWQFQSNDGGVNWGVDWKDDVCDAWPTEYMRRKFFLAVFYFCYFLM